MDIHSCVISLYSVFLVCLFATGIAHGQWTDDAVDELLNDLQLDSSSSENSEYEPSRLVPEYDDKYDNYGNTLATLLKRNVYTGNYRRLPRIKQQRIIPFYSYMYKPGRYRSSPRYRSRGNYPYYNTPWNMENYRPSSYLNKQIYAGYKKK